MREREKRFRVRAYLADKSKVFAVITMKGKKIIAFSNDAIETLPTFEIPMELFFILAEAGGVPKHEIETYR